MQADAVVPGEAGPQRDHGAGEGVVGDASFDAGADAATPSGTYNPVGTPTTTSAGARWTAHCGLAQAGLCPPRGPLRVHHGRL